MTDGSECLPAFSLLFSDVSASNDIEVYLTSLYLLDCWLLPRQIHNKLSSRHLKMLDDEYKFRSHRVCYDLIVNYIRKVVKNKALI